MREFSIKEVALSGYGLMRKKPGILIALAIFSVAINVIGMWLIVSTAGPSLAALMDMQQAGAEADPQAAMAALGALPVLLAIGFGIAALSYMISAGAVARAIIRPGTSKPPYVGLGADEFRLLVVGVVVGLILLVVFIAGVIVLGIATGITAMATGGMEAMASGSQQMPPAAQAVALGGYALLYVGLFLLSVRFSLAPAQSEREEAVRIWGSWALTKGRFWRTTGAYVLAVLSVVPFYILMSLIIAAVATATGAADDFAGGLMLSMQPDLSGPGALFSPTGLTTAVLNGVVVAFSWIVCLAASASVYAKVAGTVPDVADEFDDDDDFDDED